MQRSASAYKSAMTLMPNDQANPFPIRQKRALIGVILGAVIIALFAASYVFVTTYLLRSEERIKPQRASFFADSMDDALSRLEHLPFALATNPKTLDALTTGDAEELNPLLADVAARARAEFVYVLDINGRTIASSNYQAPDSLVGNLYTFRPYFRDAIEGNQGRFYAVGVTTGRPGYFISEPIMNEEGVIFGVVAVKIGIADLSRELLNSGELAFVTNEQGVVLASSKSDLIYGFISPMTAFDLRTLEEQQQFGDEALFPLDWTSQSDGRVRLNGVAYVWTPASLAKESWTLHLLSDVADIRRQALLYVSFGLLAVFSLVVAAAIYRAAQLRRALAISDADRRRLATEIEDRKIAEKKLETARSELARKTQLAALGQLSASITHELGQPISAMRNYLVAEEIATGAAPGGIWPELSGLVDRMQRILNQLRLFGRSSDAQPEHFNLQETVYAAHGLVRHTAQAAGVTIDLNLPEKPLRLLGQSDRFEQVIVNLLRNGIDAVEGQKDGKISIMVENHSNAIVLIVRDNGPGLEGLNIADLREPFFSTKPSGKGMGLGLAISGQIVNEMGGSLRAEDDPDQGAVFSVSFPQGDTPDES